MIEIEPCPFCGGRGKVSERVVSIIRNYYGDSKTKMRVQVICNKCHARGRPVTTDWLKNYNLWQTPYLEMKKMISPYTTKCIEFWNRRTNENER